MTLFDVTQRNLFGISTLLHVDRGTNNENAAKSRFLQIAIPMKHKDRILFPLTSHIQQTMKVASTLVLVTFCATAVSAFGLNHGVRSGIQTAKKAGFPLVKPIDLQGNRLNSVVSANNI